MPEYYRIPQETGYVLDCAKKWGGQVIAVGTTVIRALESACDEEGKVRAGEGTADLIFTPDTRIRATDGIITAFHPEEASHLRILEAVVGSEVLKLSYSEARQRGYAWGVSGDRQLLLRN